MTTVIIIPYFAEDSSNCYYETSCSNYWRQGVASGLRAFTKDTADTWAERERFAAAAAVVGGPLTA
jgi:hypothetical protein